MKDVLGNGPIIPFGSLVEYHPITRRISRESIGKKVLPGLGALYAGRIWKGDVLADLRSWKRWTHRKSTRKDQCERGDISLFFQSQMDESKPLEEIRN